VYGWQIIIVDGWKVFHMNRSLIRVSPYTKLTMSTRSALISIDPTAHRVTIATEGGTATIDAIRINRVSGRSSASQPRGLYLELVAPPEVFVIGAANRTEQMQLEALVAALVSAAADARLQAALDGMTGPSPVRSSQRLS
jgi:hypothetical protein